MSNNRPNDDQMCCCRCGHIAKEDDAYDTDRADEEDLLICPECGNTNVGGYPCYAPAGVWQEEDLQRIIEFNKENQ